MGIKSCLNRLLQNKGCSALKNVWKYNYRTTESDRSKFPLLQQNYNHLKYRFMRSKSSPLVRVDSEAQSPKHRIPDVSPSSHWDGNMQLYGIQSTLYSTLALWHYTAYNDNWRALRILCLTECERRERFHLIFRFPVGLAAMLQLEYCTCAYSAD